MGGNIKELTQISLEEVVQLQLITFTMIFCFLEIMIELRVDLSLCCAA